MQLLVILIQEVDRPEILEEELPLMFVGFLNYWRSLHPRGQHFLTTCLLERIHVVPKVLVIEIQEFDILEISKDDLPEVFLQDMYLCIT